MIEFLKKLIFIPKCVVCGEILPLDTAVPFCPKCRLEYEKLCRVPCTLCKKDEAHCRCVPTSLLGTHTDAVHLFSFDSELSRTLIYLLKRKNLRVLQDFFARELSTLLQSAFPIDELCEYAVTYAPRSAKGVRLYGFDQAEILGKGVARRLNCPMIRCFSHTRRSVEQKTQDAEGRGENAEKSFCLAKKPFPITQGLIIVDDVMTTGSTMAKLISLARDAGYKKIIAVTVAKTAHRKK